MLWSGMSVWEGVVPYGPNLTHIGGKPLSVHFFQISSHKGLHSRSRFLGTKIFPKFYRATGPDICSLVTVLAIRGVTFSLILSCLENKGQELRPLSSREGWWPKCFDKYSEIVETTFVVSCFADMRHGYNFVPSQTQKK